MGWPEKAVDRSTSHNEIVTVVVGDIHEAYKDFADLYEVDDYVDTTGPYGSLIREMWGSDPEGNDYRVHLATPETLPDDDYYR